MRKTGKSSPRSLQWWIVAVSTLGIGVLTAVPFLGVGSWAYIAPGRLFSLPHESVFYSGTLAALVAAWLGARELGRRSSTRQDGLRRSLRLSALLLCLWVGVHLVVACGLTGYWLTRATWRQIYAWDLLVSAAGLAFFTLTGLLVGKLCSRWFAPLIALAWAAFWHQVLPWAVTYLPYSGTNTEFFLYPAMSQQDHRALDPAVMFIIALWWFLLLALLLGCLVASTPEAISRPVPRMPIWLAAFGLCASGVIYMPWLTSTPFVEGSLEPFVCQDANQHVRVCVTEQQQAALPALVEAVMPVVDHMGRFWPTELTTLATKDASRSMTASGVAPTSIALTNVSSFGTGDSAAGVASSLSGSSSCMSNGGSPIWGFAFSDWLVPSDQSLPPTDPTMATFAGKSDEQVLRWYQTNRDALFSCTYDGPGPI